MKENKKTIGEILGDKPQKSFNWAWIGAPIMILMFGLVTAGIATAFASTNYEAEHNAVTNEIIFNQDKISHKQMEIEQLNKHIEALNSDLCEIEKSWCSEKLENHYALKGQSELSTEDVTRCVFKTAQECVTTVPEETHESAEEVF